MAEALIASLAMYDFPWTAEAYGTLWAAMANRLRASGVDAPPRLTRGGDLHETWRRANLILGQTCGYPYVTALRQRVALVATPIYAFPGCEGAQHRSFVVARKEAAGRCLEDFAGVRVALNAYDSNSGMNLFRATVAPLAKGRRFFGSAVVTGAHVASLEAVIEGRADIAAIDCVTFGLLRRGRPSLTDAVTLIAETPLSPALPLVMNADLAKTYLKPVRAALFAALEDPALANARETLGLVGAEILDDADYDRVAAFEREAVALGYPELA
jgi:ABC-type phosphate/phosphonate transport system substrate-binding protein